MSREVHHEGGNKIYYQVFNGEFRTKVPEGTVGALERINKNNVRVFERKVSSLAGRIENIAIEASDFGKQLKITLDTNASGSNPVFSFGIESKDGRDILKKLPAIDFEQEVCFTPYRFTPEGETQEKSGVTVAQPNEDGEFTKKIGNHFFDPIKKAFIHDFPTINWDDATESAQKIYKIQRDEFLLDYTTKHILPRFGEGAPANESNSISYNSAQKDFDADDLKDSIPF